MIIDTHIHESKHSFDSIIDFAKLTKLSKKLGLDGVCITNHENNSLRNEIGDSAKIDDVLVIVGAEVLTYEGDILVFGLKDIPDYKMSAEELLNIVRKNNGAAVAAHPFRNNNRGLGNNIKQLAHMLTGVESFNGSTMAHHNLESYTLSTELNIPSLGASDAHKLEKVGTYATKFYDSIRDHKDFVEALHAGNFHPVMRQASEYKNIDYYYENHIQDKKIAVNL